MRKSLNSLVAKEAKALLLNATNYELRKLNFNDLSSTNKRQCVYGQMTYDCFSPRAVELIEACCDSIYMAKSSSRIMGTLNGSPKKERRENYWSPIEMFIDIESNKTNGNNEMLIAFLKGKRKTLMFVK